jgi:hypothetical protein
MDDSFEEGAWTMIGPPILDLEVCVQGWGRATIPLDPEIEGMETSGVVLSNMDLPFVMDRFEVSGVLERGESLTIPVRPTDGCETIGWLGVEPVVGTLTCGWERDWRFALAVSNIRFTEDSRRGFVRCTGDEGALNERLGADACGDAACLGLAWDWGAGWLFRGEDDPFWARVGPTKTIKTRHAVLRCNLLDIFSDDMAILLSSTFNLPGKPMADPANGLAYYYKAIKRVLVTAKDALIKEAEGEFEKKPISQAFSSELYTHEAGHDYNQLLLLNL